MEGKIRPKKILLTESSVQHIRDEVKLWGNRGLETGGYYVGKIHPNFVYEITDLIDAGPNAERSGASFTPDYEHAMKVMSEIKKKHPEKRYLGEWHLHPWKGEPHPSGIDLEQLKKSSEKRPWYVIMLHSLDEYRFLDLNDDGTDFYDVSHTIIPDSVTQESVLDRIRSVTSSPVLQDKHVVIIGLGSLGSVIAKYLGCTGIGQLSLIDNEELETVNVIRHEGDIHDVGRPKTEICKDIIESHNPFIVTEEHRFDVTSDTERLKKLIECADLVVSCSGSPAVNHLVNGLCNQEKKPCIYAAVFAKAKGGYHLTCIPEEGNACFNCLFHITSSAYHVDSDQAARYGLNIEELHQQQGLWTDISLVAIMACRKVLQILKGEPQQNNLVLLDSQLNPREMKLAKRSDCATCNTEGWLDSQNQIISEREPDSDAPGGSSKNGLLSKMTRPLRRIVHRRQAES